MAGEDERRPGEGAGRARPPRAGWPSCESPGWGEKKKEGAGREATQAWSRSASLEARRRRRRRRRRRSPWLAPPRHEAAPRLLLLLLLPPVARRRRLARPPLWMPLRLGAGSCAPLPVLLPQPARRRLG